MPMKMRPQSFDPVTVEGFRQQLLRQRRFRPFGCGCGRWLVGCMTLILSVSIICSLSTFFYLSNPPERINILIVRADAFREKDTRIAEADSLMVISIDPRHERITLFSIPTDVVITSPTFGKLPAFAIIPTAELQAPGSGLRELEKSIESTFSIPIEHTVRVNFEDFVKIVNAVGGIEIDVAKYVIDNEYPTPEGGTVTIQFDPGLQTMDGATALIYTRTHRLDDNFQRENRQQEVMQASLDKLTTSANAPRLPRVLIAVLGNTETDMHIGDFSEVLPAVLLYGRSENIERFVLDDAWLTADDTGNMSPDTEKLDEWLDEYLR